MSLLTVPQPPCHLAQLSAELAEAASRDCGLFAARASLLSHGCPTIQHGADAAGCADADGSGCTLGSVAAASGCFRGAFPTVDEIDPWLQLDLGSVQDLGSVVVGWDLAFVPGRGMVAAPDASPSTCEYVVEAKVGGVAKAGNTFMEVARVEVDDRLARGAWDRVALPRGAKGRFVRVRIVDFTGRDEFSIGAVEVHAPLTHRPAHSPPALVEVCASYVSSERARFEPHFAPTAAVRTLQDYEQYTLCLWGGNVEGSQMTGSREGTETTGAAQKAADEAQQAMDNLPDGVGRYASISRCDGRTLWMYCDPEEEPLPTMHAIVRIDVTGDRKWVISERSHDAPSVYKVVLDARSPPWDDGQGDLDASGEWKDTWEGLGGDVVAAKIRAVEEAAAVARVIAEEAQRREAAMNHMPTRPASLCLYKFPNDFRIRALRVPQAPPPQTPRDGEKVEALPTKFEEFREQFCIFRYDVISLPVVSAARVARPASPELARDATGRLRTKRKPKSKGSPSEGLTREDKVDEYELLRRELANDEGDDAGHDRGVIGGGVRGSSSSSSSSSSNGVFGKPLLAIEVDRRTRLSAELLKAGKAMVDCLVEHCGEAINYGFTESTGSVTGDGIAAACVGGRTSGLLDGWLNAADTAGLMAHFQWRIGRRVGFLDVAAVQEGARYSDLLLYAPHVDYVVASDAETAEDLRDTHFVEQQVVIPLEGARVVETRAIWGDERDETGLGVAEGDLRGAFANTAASGNAGEQKEQTEQTAALVVGLTEDGGVRSSAVARLSGYNPFAREMACAPDLPLEDILRAGLDSRLAYWRGRCRLRIMGQLPYPDGSGEYPPHPYVRALSILKCDALMPLVDACQETLSALPPDVEVPWDHDLLTILRALDYAQGVMPQPKNTDDECDEASNAELPESSSSMAALESPRPPRSPGSPGSPGSPDTSPPASAKVLSLRLNARQEKRRGILSLESRFDGLCRHRVSTSDFTEGGWTCGRQNSFGVRVDSLGDLLESYGLPPEMSAAERRKSSIVMRRLLAKKVTNQCSRIQVSERGTGGLCSYETRHKTGRCLKCNLRSFAVRGMDVIAYYHNDLVIVSSDAR